MQSAFALTGAEFFEGLELSVAVLNLALHVSEASQVQFCRLSKYDFECIISIPVPSGTARHTYWEIDILHYAK